MFAVNLLGPYALLRALLPFLVAGQGQVVFLNSTQGLAASGGVGQFAATQHAMHVIADSLRDEVNVKGVRVLSLFLGRTASDRQRAIFAMEGRPYPEELLYPARRRSTGGARHAEAPAHGGSNSTHLTADAEGLTPASQFT